MGILKIKIHAINNTPSPMGRSFTSYLYKYLHNFTVMNTKQILANIKTGQPFQGPDFEISFGVFNDKYCLVLNKKVGDKFEMSPLTNDEAIVIIEQSQ